jgi:hypothetical protein
MVRPRSTNSWRVRVRRRTGHEGWYVFIGNNLYDRMGQPKFLHLFRTGGSLYAERAQSPPYTVTNVAVGTPRLSVGNEAAEQLRLSAGLFRGIVTRFGVSWADS